MSNRRKDLRVRRPRKPAFPFHLDFIFACYSTMIAEHVWNYDVFNQSNVVDVYIRNLRRKIDDGHDLKLIHTVRGAGYRLSATEGADL